MSGWRGELAAEWHGNEPGGAIDALLGRSRNAGIGAPDRELLSRRLVLFAKALCLFIIGTYPIGLAELYGSYGLGWRELSRHPVHIQPLLAGVVAIIWAWLSLRPRRQRTLEAIDSLLLIGFSALWVTIIAYVIRHYPEKATSAQVDTGSVTIVVTLLVVGRAAWIPSRPLRTALVSALAFTPLCALAYARDVLPGWEAPQPPLFRIVALLALGVLVATLSSTIIHRLRQAVEEARRLGPYELREKLGSGASGIVYRAQHALLKRETAIKVLRPDRSSSIDIQRFSREVRLASRLTHPNTVAVYDYGHTPEGLFYYAMELCTGTDLQRLVARHGPQPAERVASILVQICGALAEAHEAGLVHRDIKPANILLGVRGGVSDVAKLADFGLARELGPGSEAGSTTAGTGLAGTPAYMPPEALDARERVDERSDLYCVGGVAYYLLTGTPVFQASGLIELCAHHLASQPEPPSSRLGGPVPEQLERIVLQCLAKDRASRPPSARHVAAHLESLAAAWTQERARRWWCDRGAAGDLLPMRGRELGDQLRA